MVENNQLLKNSVVFPIAHRKVEIGLYFTEQKKLKKVSRHHFSKETKRQDILDRMEDYVWLDFKKEKADAVFSFYIHEHTYLARWWYEQLIYSELKQVLRLVRRTFTGEWQYWVEDTQARNKKTHVFRKFNLNFRVVKDYTCMEVVVSYVGRSQVILQDIETLVSSYRLDTSLLKSVIFERECQPYGRLAEDIRLQHNKVFPILGRDIARFLDMDMPINKDPFKLSTAVAEIQMFFNHYLNHERLKKHLGPFENWVSVKEEDAFEIKDPSRKMVFGNQKVSENIYMAFQNHGPYRLPEIKHYQVFFIHIAAAIPVRKELVKHLSQEQGYTSLQSYSHLPLLYHEELDYEIKDIKLLKEGLAEHIQGLHLNPEVQYMAIYLSPYGKYGGTTIQTGYYYQVKEVLLKRGIVSQVIDQNKVKGNINFWIPNISMAMIAKMGGIPWKLSRSNEKELIIGFGAFRSGDSKQPYVGSSFCFDNEGRFQEFDCWSEVHEWNLLGQLHKAIKAYQQKHQQIERLVIHYYKELNKFEFRQVERLLDRFDSKIPIIVVRINSTFQHQELVMDLSHPKYLAVNGSYYHLRYHDYLLYINDRMNKGGMNVKSARYPLKVSLQSNKPGLFDEDPDLVPRLMQQLYDFSLLHWRSISQPRLPVTIVYPQYLARIFPHFEADTLMEMGRTRLWFL